VIPEADLRSLDATVAAALDTGDLSALDVLGFGEVTVVLGWPPGERRLACKRLPPFADRDALDRYTSVVTDYVAELAGRGIPVQETAVCSVDGPAGRLHAYCVQQVLPASTLGPAVLRAADPHAGHPLADAIVGAVLHGVDERVGLDAQLSNWAWAGGTLRYFDVTTPFLRDGEGRGRLDLAVFLAALPWALRPLLGRFVFPGVVARFHDPRAVLVDLVANLEKERLLAWAPAFLEVANASLDRPITTEEPRRYYRSDARLWRATQAIRRADRWWQRRVRRRAYDFLLPGRIER
jgi:hypothetical protein